MLKTNFDTLLSVVAYYVVIYRLLQVSEYGPTAGRGKINLPHQQPMTWRHQWLRGIPDWPPLCRGNFRCGNFGSSGRAPFRGEWWWSLRPWPCTIEILGLDVACIYACRTIKIAKKRSAEKTRLTRFILSKKIVANGLDRQLMVTPLWACLGIQGKLSIFQQYFLLLDLRFLCPAQKENEAVWPGADPTTSSCNAGVVKIYGETNSMARFYNIFFSGVKTPTITLAL
jgi:hypothetical protein